MAITSTVNTLAYDPDLCVGCGVCSIVCPHGVFALADSSDESAAEGNVAQLMRPEACMECGACQLNCPTGAIRVDSGVGCAAAMIYAALTGRPVSCGCGGGEAEC